MTVWRFGFAFLSGVRALRHQPSYAIASVLLIGISSTAFFIIAAIVDALLVRPPSARDVRELVFIHSPLPDGLVSRPDYIDLAQRSTSFEGLLAYYRGETVAVRAQGPSLESACQAVSANFFATLGVSQLRGRLFQPADDIPGSEPVALLAESLSKRLGVAIGALVEINTRPFRVIGTLPDDYQALDRQQRPEIWIPLVHVVPTYRPSWLLEGPTTRSTTWLRIAGRLKSGVMAEVARDELNRLARQIQLEHPDVVAHTVFSVTSFPAMRFSQDRRARTMLLLGGSVLALFLLALTNFSLLTLVRASTRRHEVALRIALGAGFGDIAAGLAGELATLLSLGLAAGLGTSRLVLGRLLLDLEVGRWLSAAAVAVDLRSGSVVVATALAGGLLLWLLSCPRFRAHDLYLSLKQGGSMPGRQRRLLALLSAELGLALLLVSLSLASLGALRTASARPMPLRTEDVLLLNLSTAQFGWATDPERTKHFFEQLVERLRAIPGVISVALSDYAPLGGMNYTSVFVGDVDPRLAPDRCRARFASVGPEYFDVLGLRLQEGRGIAEADQKQQLYLANGLPSGNRNVAVINQAMAKRFWPQEASALGQVFLPWEGGILTTVIGVLESAPPTDLVSVDGPQFYLPFVGESPFALALLHVTEDSSEVRARSTAQLAALWPVPEVPRWRTMQEHIDSVQSALLTSVHVLFWVALFSGIVAGSGIYFFSAFITARTLRASALQLALGATWQRLVGQHLKRSFWSAALGLTCGGALVFASRPVLAGLDVTVESPSAVHFVLAVLPLSIVSLLGLVAPLWGLRRVDVGRALARL